MKSYEIEELEEKKMDHILLDAEEVEIVTTKKGAKPVISLRLDREILRELEIYAREIGEKPTVLARELIEEGLHNAGRSLSSDKLLDIAKLRIKAEKNELLAKQKEVGRKSPTVKKKAEARKSTRTSKSTQVKSTGGKS